MGKTTRWNWDKFPHFALHCFWWIEWSHYRTMKYKPLLSDGSTWLVSGLEGFFLLPCQDTQKDGFADVRTSWELWKDLPEKRERGHLKNWSYKLKQNVLYGGFPSICSRQMTNLLSITSVSSWAIISTVSNNFWAIREWMCFTFKFFRSRYYHCRELWGLPLDDHIQILPLPYWTTFVTMVHSSKTLYLHNASFAPLQHRTERTVLEHGWTRRRFSSIWSYSTKYMLDRHDEVVW